MMGMHANTNTSILGNHRDIVRWVVVALLALIGSATGGESEAWLQRYEEHKRAFYNGDGFLHFDYRANDRVSNDQADLIESCLYAYRTTGDIVWLEQAARLADGVMAKVGDLDGNGRRGWDTARYSLNLIQNPTFADVQILEKRELEKWDFEFASSVDPTLPEGWRRSQANVNTVSRNAVAGVEGSAGVVIRTDGTNWVGVEAALPTYSPGAYYFVEFDGLTESNSVRPRPDVRFDATFLPVSFHDSFTAGPGQWDRVGLTFRAPAQPGHALILRLGASSLAAGAELRFDNVVLGEVTRHGTQAWETLVSESTVDFEDGVIIIRSGPDMKLQGVEQTPHNPYVTNNSTYEPGIRYRVRVQSQVADPAAPGRVEVSDDTTGLLLGQTTCTNTTWSTNEFEFVAPVEVGHVLRFRLLGPSNVALPGFCRIRQPVLQQFAGHIVDEGLSVNALLRFANLVHKSPETQLRFANQAAACVALAREVAHAWESEWVERGDWGVYVVPDDGAQGQFARRSLPLNQFAMAGVVWFGLFDATGDSFALLRATKLARAAKGLLHIEEGGYSWNYFEDLVQSSAIDKAPIAIREEDTAHGNLDVAFFLAAYRHQVVFDDLDMTRLLRTFLKKMYQPATMPPQIALDVRGIRFGAGLAPFWWWTELANLHPDVLDAIAASVESRSEIDVQGPFHSELGVWYDQGWRILQKAMLAYFFKLREGGFLGPKLTLERRENGLRVTWPAWLESYELEARGSLSSAGLWERVGDIRVESGIQIHEIVSERPFSFYRLRRP